MLIGHINVMNGLLSEKDVTEAQIKTNNFDILCITEAQIDARIHSLPVFEGYKTIVNDNTDLHRVLMFAREDLKYKVINLESTIPTVSMELASFTLTVMYNEYRSRKIKLSNIQRCERLFESIAAISRRRKTILILGDLNIHLERKEDKLTKDFLRLLQSESITQIQTEPTRGSAILNPILTRNIDEIKI